MNPGALGVRVRRATRLVATIVFGLLLLAAPAHAAFPGKNGKIAFSSFRSGNYEIFTANPDASGLAKLTKSPPMGNYEPAWSPDGSKIAFSRNTGVSTYPGHVYEIFTMNADGTNQLQLTNDGATVLTPSWSPDGKKIVFETNQDDPNYVHIHVMNSDGTGETRLGSYAGTDAQPAWSPDGSKIAFVSSRDDPNAPTCDPAHRPSCVYEIYTMNPDGTGVVRLTHDGGTDSVPQWAPDGSKIVFEKPADGYPEIYAMNADGTNETRITHNAAQQVGSELPVWSPDGSKLAFQIISGGCPPDYCATSGSIYTMNPDGSGQTQMMVSGDNEEPNWQPLPITYYPRPKGATPFQTYLTVAYKSCPAGSENRQHGEPLSALSCSPPQQSSDYLTVGTLDSNGQKANAVGKVRYDVFYCPACVGPGPNEDVRINFSLTDVRNKTDLSDYTGELLETSLRRITDKNNTPAPDGTTEAATVADIPFSATVPCAATSDTTIGSTCSLSTTADAIIAGQVKENVRAIWQLSQVQVYDGGSDGQASTTADNTLFMDEGIFVP